jgi:hypothetical protein
VNFFSGYRSYYGGLIHAGQHAWRRAGFSGQCEQRHAIEDEAALAIGLRALSYPPIGAYAVAKAANWASNNKAYVAGRFAAGGITSMATGTGPYGGVSLGLLAGMGDALENIRNGANDPDQLLRSLLGERAPEIPAYLQRKSCGCDSQ